MDTIKVLLVDDEADFAAAMQRRLERRGLAVRTAHSGEECLSTLREFDADVVVLDVKMPGMDGLHTLRAIKHEHPLVEVIMLSGHACMDTAVAGMEHGAFHYLMKPADLDELMYKVEDAYKRKSLQEQKIRAMEERADPAS
nr:response regulator [Salidesulfovibrio onnuriiensis]